MRLRAAALLVGGALTLGGCYDFEAPLDTSATRPRDPALPGTWRCLAVAQPADTKPVTIVVTEAGERGYSIRFEVEDEEPDLYESHASDVGGHTLLNLRDLDPRHSRKPWTFARYSFLLPDVMRVQLVDDEKLKGVEQTSVALRAAVERFAASPELYFDFCVCVRATVQPKDGAK